MEEPIEGDWSEARWAEHDAYWDCETCSEVKYDGSESLHHDGGNFSCVTRNCNCVKSSLKTIRHLLSSYGLALPSTEYFSRAETRATKLSWAITLPAACENATETACWASEDHDTASSHHDTSEEDDRKFRRLVWDLELRIAKVEGGTGRRWSKEQVEERSRAMEKRVKEKEAEERRRGRAESGKEVGGVLAKEGAQVVQPRWMLVQLSISEY